jgi:hypothetical protein
MSHTVIRNPRMHGSPERSPGVIEILESKLFTEFLSVPVRIIAMSQQPSHEFS